MRTAEPRPIDVLLPAAHRNARESGPDAGHRRGVSEAAVLRQPTHRAGTRRESQTGATPDAGDGPGSDLPQAADHAAWRRAQDLPLFTAEYGDYARRPGVEHRHHLHPARARLLVPDGGDRLVQPLRFVVAIVAQLGR